MKSLFLFTLSTLFLLASEVGAQPDRGGARHPESRERIRAAHAAYVTERMELTSAESEKFWPVYREYHEKRRALRQKLREMHRSGADEKEMLEQDLRIRQEELDLEKSYMEKLGKIISAEKLIKLRQAEIDFRKLVLRQVQERRRPRR